MFLENDSNFSFGFKKINPTISYINLFLLSTLLKKDKRKY